MQPYHYNFSINVEYDRINNCEEYGCSEERICRCSRLENVRVKSIDLNSYITSNFKKGEVDLYFIDRIYTLNKFYDKDLFEVIIDRGYYGEEISSVLFQNEKRIQGDLKSFQNSTTLQEKIHFILKREYGYVLESCEDKDWSVETIRKDQVVFGQDRYHKRLESVERYNDYSLIKGITLYDNGKYRVIDGYHRINQSEDHFKVFVGK